MKLKLIKNDKQLNEALERVNQLWGAKSDTPERDELEVLSLLIEKYEGEYYSIPASEPIEAIKFLMDQNNLTRKDLQPFIGSMGRVSEILNRKRDLSLIMIKRLHHGLNIPYESLII
ncbi:MAG: transcriptional regulator [Methylococcaceae bacterium]|nr:transcriptional regulator [Methylococcaceae bacterium]